MVQKCKSYAHYALHLVPFSHTLLDLWNETEKRKHREAIPF